MTQTVPPHERVCFAPVQCYRRGQLVLVHHNGDWRPGRVQEVAGDVLLASCPTAETWYGDKTVRISARYVMPDDLSREENGGRR